MIKTGFDWDFMFAAACGRVPGVSPNLIVGDSPSLDTADGTNTIWDKKGIAPQLSAAATMYASSSSAADTAAFVVVIGLDENYDVKSTTTQLTGQTQVSVGDFLVVHAAQVVVADVAGDIYIAETDTLTGGVPDTDSKIHSKIIAGKNVTHNAFFVIPRGKAGVITAFRGTTDATNKSARVTSHLKYFGQPELETVSYSLAPALPNFVSPVPIGSFALGTSLGPVFPEKTRIEARTVVAANATLVFFGIDLILLDSELVIS